MIAWTGDELDKIGSAEELDIAGMREDGRLRKATTIWVVRIGDEIYVRSYKGRGSVWFRGVLERHAGHIWAGGIEKDVNFVEETSPAIVSQVDAAYRSKYRSQPAAYVDPMLTPEARTATIRLVPR